MQYNSCYKCGRTLTSGEVDGLCLNCKTQMHVPALLAEFSALRAENAKLKARVEAAEKYINKLEDYLDVDAVVTTDSIVDAAQKWEALK